MSRPARRQRRCRLFGVFLAAFALVGLSVVPANGSPARLAARSDTCIHYPDGVPMAAYDVENFVRSHNFTPPRFHKGGSIYNNFDGKILNLGNEVLREYDIYPSNAQEPRGPERIVLGESPHTSWYTPDHYNSFIQMYQPPCFLLF